MRLLSIMIITTIILCLLAILIPASRPLLFPENKIVENLTAIIYLAAFTTAIFHVKRHKIVRLIAFFSFFGFLEELSYGKFIFNYHFPKYYGLDLPNLHNFVQLPYFALKNSTLAMIAFLIFLAAATLAGTYMLYTHRKRLDFHPVVPYLLIFIVLIIGAITLDMGIAYHRFFPYIEELLELNASLTLLFAAHNFKYQMKRSKATGP